ncbi:hypothetical protein ABDK00_009365 [Niabella insulamsoli]|uniref:hypothetical protein n=1 Tax=Niabella insulamsoli TaxID=3144874 RepID=UPI0031FCA33D
MKKPMMFLQKPGLPVDVKKLEQQSSSSQIINDHNRAITMQNVVVRAKRARMYADAFWGTIVEILFAQLIFLTVRDIEDTKALPPP